MKRDVGNLELRQKMSEAVNMLCDTVKTTLGPKGSNVIIDHSTFSPFITNDGVTIAMNIESEDEVINTILEIAKEASIKTNDKVGDGTTTTLVLLQSIFNNGMKLIEEGKNPIILKKELDENLEQIINYLKSESYEPKNEDLYKIAKISANSHELGKLITDAYLKVKNINAISIKENKNNETKILYRKGYTIDTLIGSQYFFRDTNQINLTNTKILIVNNYLNDIEEIGKVLNYIIKKKKELLIICEDYSDLFMNQILNLFLNENILVYLLKVPEYGKNKIDTLNDLSLISNSKIVDDISYISELMLGDIKSVNIDKEYTTFCVEDNLKINEKIIELKKIENKNDIDINFINKRISMLENGLIDILVGASTDTERREKKMRCDDALYAISTSKNGILPGSGIKLYELSDSMDIINDTTKILINSLKEPFKQIMYNSGLDGESIINNIKKEKYNIIFNINNDSYENIKDTEVVDPLYVIINSLINSISIAGMLLTTSSLVINEYVNKNNNIFNEI